MQPAKIFGVLDWAQNTSDPVKVLNKTRKTLKTPFD